MEADTTGQLSGFLACRSLADLRRLRKVDSSSFSFITLACKHNRADLLKILLEDETADGAVVVTPRWGLVEQKDDGHNAVYYAIRSSNVELLSTLIKTVHSELLEPLISESYEELLLNNVLLTGEMNMFVQYKLIDLRFFSKGDDAPRVTLSANNNIKERIELLLENIVDINKYTEVDNHFLYTAKFIAQNIHILKHQLKSTYNILPWEEMEFCLVSFMAAHIRRQELNIFYLSVLRKDRLLKELDKFAFDLQDLEEYIRSTDVRKLRRSVIGSREDVAAAISSRYSDLCADYKEVRDVSSLHIMKTYLDAALRADSTTRLGQLTIKRALQVTGEHMKDTLESPKLSSAVSDLILLSAPKETRKVLQGLRNSLSHPHIDFEDDQMYSNIKKDVKKIVSVITDVLNFYKAEKMKSFLTTIINSDNIDEILQIVNLRLNVCIMDLLKIDTDIKDHRNIKDLISDIESTIKKVDQTPYEKELFAEIKDIAGKTKENLAFENFYWITITTVLDSDPYVHSPKSLDIMLRNIKFTANKALEAFPCQKLYSEIKKSDYLGNLLIKLCNSLRLRMPDIFIDIIPIVITCLNVSIMYRNQSNINCIDEYSRQILLDKVNKNYNLGEKCNVKNDKNSNEIISEQLTMKLTELKNTLGTDRMSGKLYEHISLLHKDENTNRFMVEALVLDIMSILDNSNRFLNNVMYLDGNIPLLSGKCLRNHLAHENALVDILPTDAWSAVLLNAVKLTENKGLSLNSKVGCILKHNIKKLRQRYEQGLYILEKQKDMWKSLLDGHFENFTKGIAKGADIYSRKENLSSTLHYAARGPNIKIVIFLAKQKLINTDSKDVNGQTALHVAAAFGRDAAVKFLVEEMKCPINQVDIAGKTPLHLASQNGHKKTVMMLLLLGAKTMVRDANNECPMHYAVRNDFLDVVIILSEKDTTLDLNVNKGDYTSLHIAAENDNGKMVHYLLLKEADVNAKTHLGKIPLHFATSNGHLEIVNILIENGAHVNFRDSEGFSLLHCAVQNNHQEIVKVLLEKGAFVNNGDFTYNNTPFHIAVLNGNEFIVSLLLKYQVNVNAISNDGFTPLLFAAKGGHADIVELLLQNCALMESRDINGSTALHIAAEHGRTSVVETLVLNGIDIHVQNNYKVTPLHLAAEAGHQRVVDILLDLGVDVNSTNDEGFTALHLSTSKGHEAISEVLLKKGAKVSCVSNLGYTPLHSAVTKTCNIKIIQLLLKHGADANVKEKLCRTALHCASFAGDSSAVEVLLQGTAEVNAEDNNGSTALLMAASGNHKAIVEILLKYRVDVNHADITGSSALCCAARNNNIDLLDILINNGADVNVGGGKLLFSAIKAGHRHVVESLLNNKDIDINFKDHNELSLLGTAALNGDEFIARALIKRGYRVEEEVTEFTQSPLLSAILLGHMKFVEVLLENGANINSVNPDLSPLHFAIHVGMPVERLLHWGAKSNIRDLKNRLPLELAVSHSQIQNTLILLQQPGVMINEKGSDDWTLLHIAAQAGNLEIIKLLIDRGADINARHNPGAKPIHIAARNGHLDILTFFLELGIDINDPGSAGLTLIHYAATGGQIAVAKYLIGRHIGIDSNSFFGLKPLHCAAEQGQTEMAKFFLRSGAVYDAMDFLGRTPLDLTKNQDIKEVLESTEKLFKAVKKNDVLMVGILARDLSQYLNTKSSDNATLLHLASWKGFQDVCDILLKMKANPNALGKGGYSPLHYASKYSHPGIVESLLKNGAAYDIKAENMKTPLNFATQKHIKSLLIRVALCFGKVISHDVEVIKDINKIRNIEIIKTVMKARNTDGNTLVVVAMKNGFTDVDKLKQVSQANVNRALLKVQSLYIIEKFTEAIDLLKQLLNESIDILGEDNPGTLDIQHEIAVILYKQCKYFEAMPMLEDIYKKRVDAFGPHHPDSLKTRSTIALLLHRLGRDRESWNIFQEVIPRQQEALGDKHAELLRTKTHAGLTLYALEKYEEALRLNTEVYKILKNDLPAYHPHILVMQNNIAIVLAAQGKLYEAFSLYQTVYEAREMFFGLNHSDTLRARRNMATVLMCQHKFNEAMQVFQETLAIQKNVLGLNHADTLHTQRLITDAYINRRDFFNAAKMNKAGSNARIATFGMNHPHFTKLGGFLDHLLEFAHVPPCDFNLLKAASEGNRGEIWRLIESGSDVNTADDMGRTALHFSATVEITELLLDNGADATAVSQKGNTPLHLATSRACEETVRILLQNVKKTKSKAYFKFINAKTVVVGSTALHVAAEKGFVNIVSCLLEHGACYDSRDRSGNRTPMQCSRNSLVIKLLSLADEVFEMAELGGTVLPVGDNRHLAAVVNSRDSENRTPLQLALVNHHTRTARLFERLLKTRN